MGLSDFALQTAIYDALVADAALVALVSTRIHDHVPDSETYPFVVVGDDYAEEWDTKNVEGQEFQITIHVWDQTPGRKTVKDIMGAIYDVLHNNEVDVTGFHNVLLQYVSSESMVEPENATRHGVVRFRALVEED